MLNIIRRGEPTKLNPVVRFECTGCGCIFEEVFNLCDVAYDPKEQESHISLRCPCCGKTSVGSIKKRANYYEEVICEK